MRSLLNFKVWLFFSLVWIGAMAFWCFQSWPLLPLDVSHTDPETLEILERGKRQHLISHLIPALAVPAFAYIAGRILCHFTRAQSKD